MKDRPILFSGPMVRALLAGTKTQTRRIVKPQPAPDQQPRTVIGSSGFVYVMDNAPLLPYPEVRRVRWDCPYGQPGDRLWVRESFMPIPLEAAPGPSQTPWSIAYAEGGQTELLAPSSYNPTLYNYERWTPSIHMPRWASRATLEITGVRVERLQDISEADAQAEGTTPIPDPCDHVRLACADIGCSGPQPYRTGFRALWRDINGPDSWDANPWVWVVEFRRMP